MLCEAALLAALAATAPGIPPEVMDWMRTAAIPLATVEAGHGFADLALLEPMIGDAKVVALGEATHGTREFFQLKHRMLEFLVARKGFTVFAIEASLPEAMAVDDYVLNGTGDPTEALIGLGFWTWDTEEVLELIRWMRRYNEDPNHPSKLRFFGVDIQNPSAAANRLADYLRRVDPEAVAGLLSAVEPLTHPLLAQAYPGRDDSEKDITAAGLAALFARLNDRREPYTAADGKDAFETALRLATSLQQFEAKLRAGRGGSNVRDRAMADNAAWIVDHLNAKVVLWAHNNHIATEERFGFVPMGAHLRRRFGSRLRSIGISFDRGAFRALEAKNDSRNVTSFTVQASAHGSLEAALAAIGPAVFAIDLRSAPGTGVVADWIRSPMEMRSVGASFDPSRENYYSLRTSPAALYDVLVFVKETSAARPIEETGSARARRRQEPYPAKEPGNLGFLQVGSGGIPEGWAFPAGGWEGGYRLEIENQPDGRRVARIDRSGARASTGRAGNLMQAFDARPLRGRSVRFRASVKAAVDSPTDQVTLWLRVDREGGRLGFLDDMKGRPIRSSDWETIALSGPVAVDAVAIYFGMKVLGDATAWLRDVTVEALDPPAALAPQK